MKLIPLSKGEYGRVDDEDFERLNQHKWFISANGYAVRNREDWKTNPGLIRMHRVIMNTPEGLDTDHRNGNKLDNRKRNLRICTRSQNNANIRKYKNKSSTYKGVCWDKSRKKWLVSLKQGYNQIHIGRFDSEIHAAMAYDIWAKDLFGEFSYTNFKSV